MWTPFGERLQDEDQDRSSRAIGNGLRGLKMSTVTSPHILILNDDSQVLAFFQDLLKDEGYRVSTQTVVGADLATIGQLAPDVIVLDAMWLTKPDWALLQALTTDHQTRAIPVVLCTIPLMRITTLQDILDGLSVRVVTRPHTLDQLLAAIAAVLPEAS